MRRDGDFFGDQDLELVFIAKKLKEALRAEEVLTSAGIDYAVEADRYLGGVLFKRELTGAFFYVTPERVKTAKKTLREAKFKVTEVDL
jgi:hypothetical protein